MNTKLDLDNIASLDRRIVKMQRQVEELEQELVLYRKYLVETKTQRDILMAHIERQQKEKESI